MLNLTERDGVSHGLLLHALLPLALRPHGERRRRSAGPGRRGPAGLGKGAAASAAAEGETVDAVAAVRAKLRRI